MFFQLTKRSTFGGKIILVTGGLGSIGSEIVRQLLKYNPKQVRIFDNRETETFFMQHELKQHSNLRFLVGDVRDKDRLNMAMEHVNIVFHAAALKHVPLCEYNPFEAVKTNVYGTQNIIDTALTNNVEKVVNISTDKVTNTINTMGATKLLAERLISSAQYFKGNKKTIFSSVRFGNVIDSRGSIIDLFKKQIKHGGPVTITNPDMTRFVMSTKQAVNLVLKTAEEMHGGEIFILKMPIFKLNDLVEVVIEELSYKEGYDSKNIKIKNIGIREGEKLYEDLMTEVEAQNSLETQTKFIVLSKLGLPNYKGHQKNYKAIKTIKERYSSRDIKPLSKELLKRILVNEKII
ncbi:SDR family NAD(P)-dependent oxidoreductase [Candidatus Woesearchaeota archaeon]|nr:SDR family NAD(P)-dependent oxidoreductase [Candidatus Woesearchaeota archaeon]